MYSNEPALPVGDGEPALHEGDARVLERVGRPLHAELDQAEAVGRLGEQLPLHQLRGASVDTNKARSYFGNRFMSCSGR